MDTENVNFKVEHSETDDPQSSNNFLPLDKRRIDSAKERDRNKNERMAFSNLRTLIPTEPKDRKLSKIETLRLAASYIVHLANTVRARTGGDFGGQVCERYGCLFTNEVNLAPNQRHICTFCLTDSKRNYHFLSDKIRGDATILNSKRQEDIKFSQKFLQKTHQLPSLNNQFDEEVKEKLQQNSIV